MSALPSALLPAQHRPARPTRPGLRLVELEPYVRPVPSAARRARYRRRRLAAFMLLLLAAAVVVTAARLAGGALGAVPASGPESAPASNSTYTVQPGDTMWSIARSVNPTGDVRSTVAQLIGAHGSAELQIGDQLVVPART